MKRTLCILLILSLLLPFSGCTKKEIPPTHLKLTTSFYPIYIMTINITADVEGVAVSNMAEKTIGCLHDFQLQTDDVKRIENSDALIINGAGMESFLGKITAERPDLPVIDSSVGIDLIEEEDSHHHHDHDGHIHEEHDGDTEDEEHEDVNPHIWVSISNYIEQVKNIANGIIALDPENREQYQSNTARYLEQLTSLKSTMHKDLQTLSSRDIITFHEAFPYFAKEFDLNIAAIIEREPGSEPNAKELAETITLVRESSVKALFVEPQYPKTSADIVAKETDASVYVLDPAVTGSLEKDSYLKIMQQNLVVLKEALS